MSTPSYVSDQNLNFNGTLTKAALLEESNGIRTVLVWDTLDVIDRKRLDDVVSANGGTLPIPSTSGYQQVDVGASTTASDTGLVRGTAYTFSISVDGIAQAVSITPALTGAVPEPAVTYSDLIGLLSAAVTTTTVSLDAGKIKFQSKTTGSTSTIVIDQPATPPADYLFTKLLGFVGILASVAGVDGGLKPFKDYIVAETRQTFTAQYENMIVKYGNKPKNKSNPVSKDDVYYDGTTWRYMYNDQPVA